MSLKNGPHLPHYHNIIKSTNTSAVYTPSSSIISEPLTNYYTVGENIGRGKFAVVRKCTNKHTGEVVAGKFIKKRRRGKSCREEILREVVMLEMALDHPRLVNLKEVFETQQELVLITEYCAGGELFTECILEEKFNEADVRLLILQILEGLLYLHEKNIVHLDLKPQNILLTDEFPRGSVKICDLGFACLVNTGEDIRDIIGTPDYVAPEVLNYDPLGLYTDMWSLGVLTYVMLTTCSPFAAEDKQMTFSNITNVNLDFPEDLFADISMEAQDFIQKLLIAEPHNRMTAKECFSHQWIAEIINPSKSVSESTHLRTSEEHSPKQETKQSNDLNDNNKGATLSESSRESSREKVQDQASEMSVNETKDEEGVTLDTETDLEPRTQPEVSDNVSVVVIGEPNIRGVNISSDKNFTYRDEIVSVKQESANHVPSSDITPDTDSSMCISDTRLHETDSGMFTGSECKSLESLDKSGRTSANQEPEGMLDTNSEINEDLDMMNKSYLESDIKDIEVDADSVSDDTELKHPDKPEASHVQESDHEMEFEASDSLSSSVEINENNSADKVTLNRSHSRVRDNSDEQDEMCETEYDERQTVSSKNETKDVFIPGTSSIYAPNQSQGDTRAHNSVSNTDDSINSIQLGERHKRGMCNEQPGTDSAENVEEEYEFVSVSKRVRSIEDTMALSKSPPYSPKISRSPRIARHARLHHQHY